MTDGVYIRTIKISDKKDILFWRNDIFTRAFSLNTKVISFKEHHAWFSKSIKDSKCVMLICENKIGKKIGIVRFDLKKKIAEVSIHLNKEYRNKHLSNFCLYSCLSFFSKTKNIIKYYKAKIKPLNKKSIKIFLKNGFKFYKTKNNVNYYKKLLN